MYKNRYPITGILNNGKKIILKNPFDVFVASQGKMEFIDVKDEKIHITIPDSNQKVILDTHRNFGGIYSSFLSNNWKTEFMQEKTVIDVGAYLGDSSIAFVTKGAKKVIALEPLPANFKLAKKNIIQNNLEGKIELLFAACGAKEGKIHVDPIHESSHQADIKDAQEGIEVPIISLKKIINDRKIHELALKMNCEGCEYDTILESKNEILKKFDYIVIEYHYGYKNLVQKLSSCGFDTTVTPPVFSVNRKVENQHMYIGKIYAIRKH